MNIKEAISRNLNIISEQKGLTQEQIAKTIGTTKQAWNQLENEEVQTAVGMIVDTSEHEFISN